MPATRLSTAVRNAMVDGMVDLADAGSGAGTVEIRDGSQPAGPASSASGTTLLATLTLGDPAFGAASGGTATAASITGDNSADASGTATWFRVKDSSGNALWDGSCSESGGGGDMILDDTDIVMGGEVNISSWTVTQPAS